MGRNSKNETPEMFEVRLKVGGDKGQELWSIVEGKRVAESRTTLRETVAAIIVEYGASKVKSKK